MLTFIAVLLIGFLLLILTVRFLTVGIDRLFKDIDSSGKLAGFFTYVGLIVLFAFLMALLK